MITLFDHLKAIRPPSRDYSEKFSYNLAAWIRANRNTALGFFFAPKLFDSKKEVNWSPEITCPSLIVVGRLDEDGWLSGSRLSSILCNGRKEDVWAFVPKHGPYTEITDQLFPRYLQVGKCAFDPEHTLYIDGWKVDGPHRTCQWCGRQERRVEREETVTKTSWELLLVPA